MKEIINKYFGFCETLGSVRIPSPTRLVAEMIALRLAQIPLYDNNIFIIPLTNGNRIELKIEYHYHYNRYNLVYAVLLGPKDIKYCQSYPNNTYSSVFKKLQFNVEENQIIVKEALALKKRTELHNNLIKETKKQQDALDVLENMI